MLTNKKNSRGGAGRLPQAPAALAVVSALFLSAPHAARAQQIVAPPPPAPLAGEAARDGATAFVENRIRINRTAPVLRGGTITLKVDNFDDARRQIIAAAQEQGATLADARVEVNGKGRRHGWLRLSLPAENLTPMLAAVRASGKLYSENIITNDRASEYEDLGRRVIRLREHQARLDALLQNGRRLRGSDILYVQERLFRAGVDEGMLLQRQTDLSRAGGASSVVVALFEPVPVSATARARVDLANGWASGRERASWTLQRNLARGATASAYALVWSPLWLPALIIALLLLRFLGARWRQSEASEQLAALALALGIALAALARRTVVALAARSSFAQTNAAAAAPPRFHDAAAPNAEAPPLVPVQPLPGPRD